MQRDRPPDSCADSMEPDRHRHTFQPRKIRDPSLCNDRDAETPDPRECALHNDRDRRRQHRNITQNRRRTERYFEPRSFPCRRCRRRHQPSPETAPPAASQTWHDVPPDKTHRTESRRRRRLEKRQGRICTCRIDTAGRLKAGLTPNTKKPPSFYKELLCKSFYHF